MIITAARQSPTHHITHIALELTNPCRPPCPAGHSPSTPPDSWCRLLTEATELGAESVRFAGGEPTTHPAFGEILCHAIRARLDIEVVTDLVHINRCQWTLFTHERVRLATRWYSDDPVQHEAITHHPGSHLRTRTNIATALGLHIPLRVDIVETIPDQRIGAARAELLLLGIRPDRIDIDRLQAPPETTNSLTQSPTSPTILANGDVATGPSHRRLVVGNVLRRPLTEILATPTWAPAPPTKPAPPTIPTPNEATVPKPTTPARPHPSPRPTDPPSTTLCLLGRSNCGQPPFPAPRPPLTPDQKHTAHDPPTPPSPSP